MDVPEIRLAREDDVEEISRILADAFEPFRSFYTDEAFRATTISPREVLLRMREGPVWIAVDGDTLLGTASAVMGEDGCYIRGMAVRPSQQSKGIGRQFLYEIEKTALKSGVSRLHLLTTEVLDAAIHLYEAFGFVRIVGGPSDFHGTRVIAYEKIIGRPAASAPQGPA